LVGYWNLDEGTGATAKDGSGNGNDGTINGALWTSGKVGGALSFDGVNDYVDCGTRSILMPTTAITVEAWFKANNVNAYGTIVSTFYNEGYFLRINPNFAGIEFAPGICYSPTGIIQPGVWYHAAGTFDGTLAQIYVNGQAVGSQRSGYLAYTGQSLRIGNNPIAELWFNGVIDEVKIYNRALSAAEILGEYTSQSSGLVGYWSLDEGSGATAYDSSGNSNDGTVNGALWTVGKVGGALSFDGVNDYVDCGTGSSLMPTSAITVEAWFNTNSVSTYGTIASTFYYWGYFLRINPNFAGIEFAPGICYSPTGIIQTGVWYHVAGTFDGTLAQIYVNGQLVGSQRSGSLTYSGQSRLRIGNNPDGALWFNGVIDEVKIYNRALSAAEILAEYTAGLIGPYCELLGETFTQNFGSLSYNVTAVQQLYPTWPSTQTGPAYLLCGLSNTGFMYEVGLSWDYFGTRDGNTVNGRYIAGWNAFYAVFNQSGYIVYPATGLPLLVTLNIRSGGSVQLALTFSQGNVNMYVHDWNTGATDSKTYSANQATYFVGLPNSPKNSVSSFTGLMTEQWHQYSYTNLNLAEVSRIDQPR
jgi:hypothetical protein